MAQSLKSCLEKHREGDGEFLNVVNPDQMVLGKVYQVFSGTAEDCPVIRILIDDDKPKDFMNEFFTASKVADLVEADLSEFRTIESYERNSLIASQAGITFWTHIAEGTVSVFDSIPSEMQAVIDSLTRDWETGSPYSIRTPGLSRLRETMEAELGEEFRRDFDALLSEFDELRGVGGGINEVSLALIAAARNELLFYDLSRWGGDVGLASKATFTRKKQRLEDIGVIVTSKQAIDIGRPRLRLHLAEDDDLLPPPIAERRKLD